MLFTSDRPIRAEVPTSGPRAAALLKAHRLLLERSVLRRTQNREEYALVARHVGVLESWHRERTGWPIYYNERDGVIRLRRRPSLAPSGVWEPWKADVVLSSPRDYACLVYLLWYARSPIVLGRGGVRQVLLSDLSSHLAQRSALRDDPSGAEDLPDVEPFDFAKRRTDYYSLRRALKALEDLGAVSIVDEVAPGAADDQGEALIEFTEVVEALIVELDQRAVVAAGERRPDPFGLAVPVLDEASSPPLRRAWRNLLLGPVFLRRDDPPAFQALLGQQRIVEQEGDDIFGYALELKPTFARFVRPSGSSLDRVTPVLNHQQRGLVHAALLLCAAVREKVALGYLPEPDDDGCLLIDRPTLVGIFSRVCSQHQRNWGSGLAELQPNTVLGRVCDVLRTAGLLRGPNARGNVLLLPTAACFRVAYPTPEPDDERNAAEQISLGMQ